MHLSDIRTYISGMRFKVVGLLEAFAIVSSRQTDHLSANSCGVWSDFCEACVCGSDHPVSFSKYIWNMFPK